MRLLAAGRIGEQFHHGERREYQGWLKQSGDLTAYEAVSREMNDAIARQTAIFFGSFDPCFRRRRERQRKLRRWFERLQQDEQHDRNNGPEHGFHSALPGAEIVVEYSIDPAQRTQTWPISWCQFNGGACQLGS